jgi:hypothetical protein
LQLNFYVTIFIYIVVVCMFVQVHSMHTLACRRSCDCAMKSSLVRIFTLE